MAVFVGRREFMATLCGASAWPLVVHAQQADKIYRLGYLGAAPAGAALMKALREGLAALGYIEGKNIVIEERRLESGTTKVKLPNSLPNWSA
jgi:putative tryptophan/tyrosine transport system substrate-binding protein